MAYKKNKVWDSLNSQNRTVKLISNLAFIFIPAIIALDMFGPYWTVLRTICGIWLIYLIKKALSQEF